MIPINILDIKDREQFRKWLIENHATERECWMVAKRGKTTPEDGLWYLDAVEENCPFSVNKSSCHMLIWFAQNERENNNSFRMPSQNNFV